MFQELVESSSMRPQSSRGEPPAWATATSEGGSDRAASAPPGPMHSNNSEPSSNPPTGHFGPISPTTDAAGHSHFGSQQQATVPATFAQQSSMPAPSYLAEPSNVAALNAPAITSSFPMPCEAPPSPPPGLNANHAVATANNSASSPMPLNANSTSPINEVPGTSQQPMPMPSTLLPQFGVGASPHSGSQGSGTQPYPNIQVQAQLQLQQQQIAAQAATAELMLKQIQKLSEAMHASTQTPGATAVPNLPSAGGAAP